jgi:hypothetical protein
VDEVVELVSQTGYHLDEVDDLVLRHFLIEVEGVERHYQFVVHLQLAFSCQYSELGQQNQRSYHN